MASALSNGFGPSPQGIDPRKLWAKVGYKPHPRQMLFHESTARFKVPACGRRFGKSRMASIDSEPQLFRVHSDGSPTKGWIVGPTYKLGAKEFEYMYQDLILNLFKGLPGIRSAFNVRTGEMYIIMPWGSSVEVRSADKPESLVSEGLDWVIVTEAAKQDRVVWEKYLRPALADYHGTATFPSTPEGFNWFKEVFDDGQRNSGHSIHEGGDWESWNFPAWENPYVYPKGFEDSEIQDQKTSDSPESDPWFWQEIAADFTAFVGAIYPEFSSASHVWHLDFDPASPNYLFFDFGFTNPFVALDVQVLPGDRIHIWREYYVSGLPTFRHAEVLSARANPDGYHIDCGFGDSADPASVTTLCQLLCPTRADPEAKTDWQQGIRVIKRFLMMREMRDPTSGEHYTEPGLTVDPSCTNTIWEFGNYKTRQQRLEDTNRKEEPRKWADHSMDALRYGLMHLYVLGAAHHLSDVVFASSAVSVVQANTSPDEQRKPANTFFSADSATMFRLGSDPSGFSEF